MPFALTFIGALLVILGFQNTYSQFGTMVAGDFTGSNNFIYWIVAILIIGALGYNDDLRPFSRAFLILIVVDIAIYNKGFFTEFQNALSSGTAQKDPTIGANLPSSGNAGGQSSSNSSSSGSGLGSIITTGASLLSLGGF